MDVLKLWINISALAAITRNRFEYVTYIYKLLAKM